MDRIYQQPVAFQWDAVCRSRFSTPVGNGKRKYQKMAFAILKALKPRLEKMGRTTDDVWAYFKSRYEVESRSEFTEEQYSVITARLQRAEQDCSPKFLQNLLLPVEKPKPIQKPIEIRHKVYPLSVHEACGF